jgi:hypothetical protein
VLSINHDMLTIFILFSLALAALGARVPYDVLKRCLKVYDTLDLGPCTAMPYSYTISKDTEDVNLYPKEAHGVKLGNIVSRIRTRGDFMKDEEQRQELEAFGFKPKKESKRDTEFDKIIAGLKIYREYAGDVDVPNNFVCSGDAWPSLWQGYRLGARIHSIRYQGAYQDAEKLSRLKKVGFDPQARKRNRYGGSLVLSALRHYRELHGDLYVPLNYEVPSDDPRYPPETHGMKLGHVVMHIRNRGSYSEYRDQLDSISFEWVASRDKEHMRAFLLAMQSMDEEGAVLEGLMGLSHN